MGGSQVHSRVCQCTRASLPGGGGAHSRAPFDKLLGCISETPTNALKSVQLRRTLCKQTDFKGIVSPGFFLLAGLLHAASFSGISSSENSLSPT